MTPAGADRSRLTLTLNVHSQRDHAQGAPLFLSRFYPSTLPSWAMPKPVLFRQRCFLPCCTALRAGGADRSPSRQ